MTNPIAPASGENDATEELLRSLIGECRDIIHDLVVPSAALHKTPEERRTFIKFVVDLVEVSASVGDTIARLRGGGATESRQRITVERAVVTAPASLPKP